MIATVTVVPSRRELQIVLMDARCLEQMQAIIETFMVISAEFPETVGGWKWVASTPGIVMNLAAE